MDWTRPKHGFITTSAQALLAEEQRKELNFDDASTDAGSELSELLAEGSIDEIATPKRDVEKATPTEMQVNHNFPFLFFW